jgi:hypothetical protein
MRVVNEPSSPVDADTVPPMRRTRASPSGWPPVCAVTCPVMVPWASSALRGSAASSAASGGTASDRQRRCLMCVLPFSAWRRRARGRRDLRRERERGSRTQTSIDARAECRIPCATRSGARRRVGETQSEPRDCRVASHALGSSRRIERVSRPATSGIKN